MSLLISEQPLLIMPKLAEKIGLNEAILTQQIHYWVQKSDKVRDGQKWIYNTHDSWLEQFPFWSKATLKRVITSLKSKGIINTGNFNRMKMDRTVWYTINYSHAVCSGISESQPEPTKDTERQADQPLGQIEPKVVSDCTDVDTKLTPSHKLIMTSAIPETTETTTETTHINKKATLLIMPEWLDRELFNDYQLMRKSIKAPMTDRAQNILINKLSKFRDQGQDISEMLENSILNNWKSIYPINKTNGGYPNVSQINQPANNSAPARVRAINAERQAQRDRPERAIN